MDLASALEIFYFFLSFFHFFMRVDVPLRRLPVHPDLPCIDYLRSVALASCASYIRVRLHD